METIETIAEVRARVQAWQARGLRVGFVPTMGNLHAGHLALVDAARASSDRTVASIFVNPTQFGPGEDYDSYPRTLDADRRELEQRGTDLVFAPPVEEIYPDGEPLTWVNVDQLDQHLCGASRPGHFRGVATVVTKLFNIVQPDLAAFGEKDYQQLAIIRRLVRDLCMPVAILPVATTRETDGLAVSSRNGYLSESERSLAPELFQQLQQARDAILAGERNYPELCRSMSRSLEERGFSVDYFEVVNADTLAPAGPDDRQLVIAAAAWLGKPRLIDNIALEIVDA
jgi:pantoate--beta-alanine ligase